MNVDFPAVLLGGPASWDFTNLTTIIALAAVYCVGCAIVQATTKGGEMGGVVLMALSFLLAIVGLTMAYGENIRTISTQAQAALGNEQVVSIVDPRKDRPVALAMDSRGCYRQVSFERKEGKLTVSGRATSIQQPPKARC